MNTDRHPNAFEQQIRTIVKKKSVESVKPVERE